MNYPEAEPRGIQLIKILVSVTNSLEDLNF